MAKWQDYSMRKLNILNKGIQSFVSFQDRMMKKLLREERLKISQNPSKQTLIAKELYDKNLETLFKKNVLKSKQ